MRTIIHRSAGKQGAVGASLLFAVAGVLASTSLAHAIDANPPAQPAAEQRVESQMADLRKQVTQLQDQIVQVNNGLAALREQVMQTIPEGVDLAAGPAHPDAARRTETSHNKFD